MAKDEKREKCLMDLADAVKKSSWVLQAMYEAEMSGVTPERRQEALECGLEDAEAAMQSLKQVAAYLTEAAGQPETSAAAAC